MSDDYLWNGSGDPDEDIVRLERMLGPLRSSAPVPSLTWPRTLPAIARWRRTRILVPYLATAAAVLLMLGSTWRTFGRGAWDVANISGQPRVGNTTIDSVGRLGVGDTLTTDARSSARIDVSTIGQVTVDANSSVRLLSTSAGHHRLALDRGTLHAFIVAPPGEFVVDTKSATATDLGCVYTLQVDDSGAGILSVAAGWVAFEYNGRESFVPAGASCLTDPDRGPGTPRYDDASEPFRRWLARFDDAHDKAALDYVLSYARPRDAVTLFHLVSRVDARDRGRVVDALASRSPMPAGVTRDAVMRLDKPALDRWWNALGLGDASWWRKWKGGYPVG